jgi:hypothetical protein
MAQMIKVDRDKIVREARYENTTPDNFFTGYFGRNSRF